MRKEKEEGVMLQYHDVFIDANARKIRHPIHDRTFSQAREGFQKEL